jgi:hypothetical protein
MGYWLASPRVGDTEFAFLILKEAETFAAARDWTGMMTESLRLRTRLLLREGRTQEAAICSERIETLAREQPIQHGLVGAIGSARWTQTQTETRGVGGQLIASGNVQRQPPFDGGMTGFWCVEGLGLKFMPL